MNIGIVTTWFERGAAYVSKQYEDILKQNHDVFIYARGGEMYAQDDPNWDKPNVYWGKYFTKTWLSTGIDLEDFQEWLTVNKINIVLFNEQIWWQPILLCRKLKIVTGAYIDYYTEETIPLFANYDFLICNTKRHYSAFDWHPQCFYVPWGTDTNLYKFINNSKKQNSITFFHSAGMNPLRKGADLTILAFSSLAEKHSDIQLLIHTQKNLNDYFPNLAQTIENLLDEGKLKIIHETVSAPGLYHKGDVYVYPSRLDGIGLTLMEAMSCGLPVITSNNAPMNEFINQKTCKTVEVKKLYCRKDGYYWPQCEVNVNDLIKQMEWYILNFARLHTLRKETRVFAEKHLQWMNNQDNLNEIILSLKLIYVEQKNIEMANSYDQKYIRYTLFERIKNKLYNFLAN